MRPMQPEDIPVLEAMMEGAESRGLPYPALDGPHIEAVQVVEDNGKVIGAAIAKSIIELYLVGDPAIHPRVRFNAVAFLHEGMIAELAELHYHEANIFLHPSLMKTFGRRLQRSWGWCANWPSFFLRRQNGQR